MANADMRLFSLSETRPFAERVAAALGIPLAEHEERSFEDGEHKARPLESVRGKDVFVVQSLYDGPDLSVNDKLCRLLFFLGALRDASAASVTAVIPYLCYARKDRKTKSRDPVTTRYLAQLLESVGIDRAVTMDVHNLAAFQNAFRCHTDHLEAKNLFVQHLAPQLREGAVVVSPDVGGIKRAEEFRLVLNKVLSVPADSAFMQKRRSAGVVSGETLAGAVEGKVAVIIDDLISTGGTIARAAKACHDQGASKVYAVATHGIFVGDATQVLTDARLEELIVTDTVPPFRLADSFAPRLHVLDTSMLFAEAIQRIHSGGSVVELLNT